MLKIDIAHETTRWSKNIIELFDRFPNYWKFIPRRIRIKLQYARYKQAGLFDAALYQKNYPDVGNAGIDPLHHYLMHGWYEGRRRL